MEWKNCKISDLGKIVTGKTPKTTIKENYGGDFPFLSPSDNMGQKHISTTAKTLTFLGKNEVKKSIIPCGSICVSCIGSDLGKVVISGREMVTNQQINSIIPNKENDGDFIYYLMSIVGKELNFLSKTSTAIPIINKSTFSNTNIRIPVNLSDQRKIAGILSALDAKIENNNKINANLEAQAQALFKSWFVDFTPFKDKPFVDSELGPIPQGWKVGKINEFVDVIYGAPYKSKLFNTQKEGLPLIRIRDLKTSSPQFYTKELLPNTELVNYGDVVAGMDAEFTPHIWLGETGLLNQRVCKFKPHTGISPLYSMLMIKPKLEFAQNYKVGTTVSHLGKSDIDKFIVIVPPLDIVKEVSSIFDAVLNEQINLAKENQRLAALRDTLLPKLMSGEIKL